MSYNITEVRLMNVPLENDYKHTLYFDTRDEQTNYFYNRSYQIASNFSYQRKDNIIRYPLNYDDLVGFNYIMYRNTKDTTKWYYAFITDIKYINDERTDIYIETDVMQTWLVEWDYFLKPSFVEREHVNSDEIGEHIIEEGLQIGEYVPCKHTRANYHSTNNDYIIVGVTKTGDDGRVLGRMYNGIYSGIRYYAFPHNSSGITDLDKFLNEYDEDAGGDAIICMFLAPDKIVNVSGNNVATGSSVNKFTINGSGYSNNYNIGVSTNNLNGYEPRNKKLMCYPYRYLLVSNNNGTSVPFRYEEFKESGEIIRPKFQIESCLTPGCSIRMVPLNYKGVDRNDEEGLNLGKYPTLNWTSDYYTNWLTQNAVNISASVIGDGIQVIGGLAMAPFTMGNSLGHVAGGLQGIAGTMGEIYKASKVPPQSKGNTNCGDVITAAATNDFHFYDMTIKSQYAKILDGYFDMFGYKVTDVKVPNINHRRCYWYTKTIDVSIDGGIPMKDLNKIKSCYNNGITFWRSNYSIGDYSLDNVIL